MKAWRINTAGQQELPLTLRVVVETPAELADLYTRMAYYDSDALERALATSYPDLTTPEWIETEELAEILETAMDCVVGEMGDR